MRIQSYYNFSQKIHQSARNKTFPLRVMFELTYRCNFRCRHCYVPFNYRKKGELKTPEIFSILNQLREIGCFYLGFTGGEPFMREDILDILWYAKRRGFEIIIYTNGSLINEGLAQELARLRPNKIDITIPAMTGTAFRKITQVNGAYKKVFRAIELLNKHKVALGFKTCVLKENQGQIEAIRNFAESLGALHRLDDRLSPRLDGSKAPYKYRGRLKDGHQSPVTSRQLEECRIEDRGSCLAGRRARIEDQKGLSKELFKCGVGVSQAAITPQGELKPCLMIDYPKFKILGDGGLGKAWENLKEFAAAIKPDKNYRCQRCELQSYCNWCPARAWLYNRSFNSCEPESWKKAELMYRVTRNT